MTIPLKQWCAEEAMREHVTPHCIYVRICRGKYPWLSLLRHNQRVILVDLEKQYDWLGLGALTEGLK